MSSLNLAGATMINNTKIKGATPGVAHAIHDEIVIK
jgi:hypothetical protein